MQVSPAAGCFILIALATRAPWPDARGAFHAVIAGALLHGGYLGFIYWAVFHGMPAGVSALIVGLQPLIAAFFAAMIVGETITARHWLGLVLGVIGVGLVVSPKLSFEVLGGITPATVTANILAAVAAALGTVYQKRFATSLNLATGAVWQYAGATLAVGLGALATEELRFDASPDALFALAWSVIVLSLGAISLLMLMIRHGDVAKVSSLIFLVPAVAAAMAFVLFGETLTMIQIAGMAVCAAAVLAVTRGGTARAG
jgi:drug/metabolite transporter (DMT)-like permease